MLNEATKKNLRRKSAYVDKVQMHMGVPLFSWVDLSLSELCNRSAGHPRACPFCPRINPKFFPNQNLHMSLKLVEKIAAELGSLDYQGTVVLCGYGEPLLHPDVVEVVKFLKQEGPQRVEIVTNGDFLTPKKLEKLLPHVDYFVVSMYDGAHQIEKLTQAFRDAGVSNEQTSDVYLLRDRWHSKEDQFGLKLTNRAGTVEVGPQDPVDNSRPCHYLAYQMQVDWNGDVLLCPQDWYRKVKYGNLNTESMFEVWTSKRMHKRRTQLFRGGRVEQPCVDCNTDGTLHGFNHVPAWSGAPNAN